VPLLPLIVPAVVAVTGWIFLLSSKVGYLNMVLHKLPLTSLCAVRIEQYGQHIRRIDVDVNLIYRCQIYFRKNRNFI